MQREQFYDYKMESKSSFTRYANRTMMLILKILEIHLSLMLIKIIRKRLGHDAQ